MKKAILITLMISGGIFAFANLMPKENSNEKSQTTKSSEASTSDKPELRNVNNKAFKPGEKLEWVVHYGFVNAGIAKVELVDEGRTIFGRKVYRVIGTGETIGAFDWFYKVRDRYETFLDAEGVFPWLFVRRVDEGGYIINQDYKFIQHKKFVENQEGKTFETPDYVQDMISAVYFARTMDMTKAKPGETFSVTSFVDNELHDAKIRFVGYETINTKSGKFNCMVFNPVIQKGRIFKNESDMNVYITNDENKIPVLVEAKILVGSVKMELTKYEGLANPLARVK
jgi:hypothetical protein